MKNKIAINFFVIVFSAIIQIQAHDIITLRPELPSSQSSGGRNLDFVPSAFLDGLELTFLHPSLVELQIILIDQSTQTTVYSETFAASRSVIIDLAEEGLEEGTYTLRVYAFGKWWWGEFIIEY